MPISNKFRAAQVASALLVAFSASALAQSPATTGSDKSASSRAATQSKSGTLAAADRNFMMKAAQSDMAEIQTGQLARDKGSSDAVKKFGERMVNDHTKTSAQLKSMAASRNVELPAAPAPKHQQEAKKLEGMSGAAFDRAYIDSQVRAHRDAVSLFRTQSKSGQDPELKAFASSTLPALEEHLKMATSLDKQGGDANAKGAMKHK